MKKDLAIIIPAYKARFLAKALASVANQTTRDFKIYVFDDGSSDPIGDIVQTALSGGVNTFSYERFENNLGGSNLTKHYDRCVKRTEEPWIWLFADDDIMEEGCVASFWKTVHESDSEYGVYCFDSIEIDTEDRVSALHPLLPACESWKQFAYFLFRGGRIVPQQAMIFSRAAYEKLGGFVEFPLGWASDQATLMALADEKGIKRISGPKVRFRKSGENISSTNNAAISSQKLQAAMQFMRWMVRRINEVPDRNFPISDESLRLLAFDWFKRHLADLRSWYSPSECLRAARFVSDTWHEPYAKAFVRMLRLNLRMALHEARARLSSPQSEMASAPQSEKMEKVDGSRELERDLSRDRPGNSRS
jgi:glycosyltransferase involved in cell wall biosynthesis